MTTTSVPLSLIQQSLLVISIEDHMNRLPEGAPFYQETRHLLRLVASTVSLEVEEASPLTHFPSSPDKRPSTELIELATKDVACS